MVEIKIDSHKDYELLKVKGEVDASSSIKLDQAISKVVSEGPKNLLIDCTELEYISSAGLGVFMSYIEEFKKNQSHLIIFGLNAKVENVFEILGLDQLLTLKATEEEAKSELS